MSVATVRRVFSSDNFLLQAARDKSSPVIYSIKKILHQIITLGFGKGLEQARIERREHEIGQLGTDILANLPQYKEINSGTDKLLHVNREQGYSVVQKGHLLLLYTDGLFIPDEQELADLTDKADYSNLINKLLDVKGTDEWKALIGELIKSVKGIEHKGLSVVKNLDNLIFECVRSNDTEFVNFAITNMTRDEHYTPAKGEQRVKAMLDTARVNDLSIKAGSNDHELMLKFFLAKNPEVSSEFATLFHKHPDLISDLSKNREYRGSKSDTNLRIIYHGLKNPLSSGNTITSLAEKLTLKPDFRPNGIIKPIAAFTRLYKELEDINAANGKLITSDVNELVDKSSEIEAGIYDTRQQINGFESDKANKTYELKEVDKKIGNLNEELNYVVALFNKAATAEEKYSASEVINRLENELLNLGETHDRLNHELEALKPEILVSLKDKLRELMVKKDSHIETLQLKVAYFSNKNTIRQIADHKYEQDLAATDSEGRITLEQLQRDISEGYFENIGELIRDYKTSHFYGNEESVTQATFLLTKTLEKGLKELARKAQTFWSQETIDSLITDVFLDDAQLEAAVKKMSQDLKYTAFKVAMTEADKVRRDYRNSLKGKVDDIVLRSLKQLPNIIVNRDWRLLGTTLETYYKALGDEPVAKVNDLLFHTLDREVKKFDAKDQAIISDFRVFMSTVYPDVSVNECLSKIMYAIGEFGYSQFMESNKSELATKHGSAIAVLDRLPDLIREKDWQSLQSSLNYYFVSLSDESYRNVSDLVLHTVAQWNKQSGNQHQAIADVFEDILYPMTDELSVSAKDLMPKIKNQITWLKEKLSGEADRAFIESQKVQQEESNLRVKLTSGANLQLTDKAYGLMDEITSKLEQKDWNGLPELICSYSEEFSQEDLQKSSEYLGFKGGHGILSMTFEEKQLFVESLNVANASAKAELVLTSLKQAIAELV